MTYSFVLVHSPLIGPYSWRAAAEQLMLKGHAAVIPSFVSEQHRSRGFADAIAHEVAAVVRDEDGLSDPLILAGHSAAGAYLPFIGSVLGRKVTMYLFVDARLPAANGASLSADDPSERQAELRRLAHGGMLPRWSDWFPPEAMAEELPDEMVRNAFLQELQPIPLALFEDPIPVPSGWPDARCAYLRLSSAYVEEAREAEAEGWGVSEIDAHHLYPLTHPNETAELILRAVEALESGEKSSQVRGIPPNPSPDYVKGPNFQDARGWDP